MGDSHEVARGLETSMLQSLNAVLYRLYIHAERYTLHREIK